MPSTIPANVYELMREAVEGRIESLESVSLGHEQVEIPTQEHFINGMYGREIVIPAGTMITGRVYKEGYLDIMLSGDISIATPQGMKRVTGTNIMEAPPGRKRAGYAHEDTHWITVHRTDLFFPDDMLDQLTFFSRQEYSRYIAKRDHESYQAVIASTGMTEEEIAKQVLNPDDQVSMPDAFSDRVTISNSAIHGLGVFANHRYEIGDHIGPGRINGMRTPIGRYTNHSAYPNAVMQPLDNGDVAMVATRLINPGDEITTHYAVSLQKQQEALCQALQQQ
ncbi:MAG: SET domain-containing protein-lysine N-methyltransferase [Pseudomonadota bacterium]